MPSKTSEHSFINKLRRTFKLTRDDVVVGIGDDAAVIKQKKNRYLLATCDIQIEGVHFKRGKISPQALVKRAVAAALSDIAAMGGTPAYMLVSAAFDKETRSSFIDKLIDGFSMAAKQYHIAIVGGNISSAPCLMLDICVLGFIKARDVLFRSGAKPGNLVLVTGTLGEKRVGKVRLQEGVFIAKSHFASAMIDISDGLSTDISHICNESNVGVRIFAKQIPIASSVTHIKEALHGGEDYELCFTAPEKNVLNLIADIQRELHTKVSIIGEILPREKGRWIVDEKGRAFPLKAGGWDHFKRRNS